MEGIKEGPSALHFGSPRRVHRCERAFCLGRHQCTASASLVRPSSLDRQPVARPSALRGMLKVLVECWSLLSESPVEVRKISTVVSDDMGSYLDPSSQNRSPF